jgi:hypothetical protein
VATHRTAALVAFLISGACGEHEPSGLALEPLGAYLTGVHPVTAVVADLDGDGDDDVAVPGLVTTDVALLENRGGEITWHPPAPLPDGASDITAIDLDGDGRVEIAATHREIAAVGIYRITAAFEIEAVDRIELDGLVTGLRAADIDGDGDDDLLVTLFHDSAVQFLVNEGGALMVGELLATSPGPYAVRVVDLDGDGAGEIVSVAASAGEIEVFSASAGGWSRTLVVATADWPSWIDSVDADGDGDLELVGAATIGDQVFAIERDGAYQALAAGDGAFGLIGGDFDADGDAELAVTNKDAGTLTLLDPRGVEPPVEIAIGDNTGPSPIYRWDLDADGFAEAVVVINAFSNEAQIYRWE